MQDDSILTSAVNQFYVKISICILSSQATIISTDLDENVKVK